MSGLWKRAGKSPSGESQQGVAMLIAAFIMALLAISFAAGYRYLGPKVNLGHSQSSYSQSTKVIQRALWAYVAKTYNLPCPASPTVASGSSADGVANCSVIQGALPWKTIGLSYSDALDGFGNRYGYAVSSGLTSGTKYKSTKPTSSDAIVVNSCTDSGNGVCTSPVPALNAYALISYGVDGKGSYLKSGSQNPGPAATSDEYQNSQVSAFTSNGTGFYVFPANGAENTNSYFGHILVYETSSQLCTDINGGLATANWKYCTTGNSKNSIGGRDSGDGNDTPPAGAPAVALANTDNAITQQSAPGNISNNANNAACANYCPGSSNGGSMSNTLSLKGTGNGYDYAFGAPCGSIIANLGSICVEDPIWNTGLYVGSPYGQSNGGGDWIGPDHENSSPQSFGTSWTPNYLVPYQTLSYILDNSYQSFGLAAYFVDGGMQVAVEGYASNAYSFTGTITQGSNSITNLSTTTGLMAGQLIEGPGIPTGAIITTVSSATSTMTISANVTTETSGYPQLTVTNAGSNYTVYGTVVSGSNSITNLSSTSNLSVNDAITSTTCGCISAGSKISSISGTTITISKNATPLIFSGTQTLNAIDNGFYILGKLTAGSSQITNAAFSNLLQNSGYNLTFLQPGMSIAGPGIPAATFINSVSGTTITMTQAATENLDITGSTTGLTFFASPWVKMGTVVISNGNATNLGHSISATGTWTAGSTSVTNVSSSQGVSVGEEVAGFGITPGTIISGITSTLTLSNNVTQTQTGGSFTVTPVSMQTTGNTTAGNAVITNIPVTTAFWVGDTVTDNTGTNSVIPANSTITAITPTTLTLSNNALATVTGQQLDEIPSGWTVTGNTSTTSNPNQITSAVFPPGLVVGQAITGTGIPSNTTVTAITNSLTLSQAPTYGMTTGKLFITGGEIQVSSISGSVTSGSAVVTGITSTTGLTIGQAISGYDIPAGTTITGLTSTTLTLSANAGATQSAETLFVGDRKPITDITGSVTNGSNQITGVGSASGLYVDATVTGLGIPAGSQITAISGTTLTISQNATGTYSATPLYFGFPISAITGNITQNSTSVTNLSTTSGLVTGQFIYGPGLATGTTITAINGTTLTLSQAALDTLTTDYFLVGYSPQAGWINPAPTMTTSTTSNPTQLTNVTSTAMPVVGKQINGSGLAVNSMVSQVTGGIVTSTKAATASASGNSLYSTFPACPGPATTLGTTSPGGLFEAPTDPYTGGVMHQPAAYAPITQHPASATAAVIMSQERPQPATSGTGLESASSNTNGLSGNYIDQRDHQIVNRQLTNSSGTPVSFNILVIQVLPYVYTNGSAANCSGSIGVGNNCPFGNIKTYGYGLLFEGAKGCFTDAYSADCTFDPRADEWANPPVTVTQDCGQRP